MTRLAGVDNRWGSDAEPRLQLTREPSCEPFRLIRCQLGEARLRRKNAVPRDRLSLQRTGEVQLVDDPRLDGTHHSDRRYWRAVSETPGTRLSTAS